MNTHVNFPEFVQDRNIALLSLDREKILAYCRKYGVNIAGDGEVFWAAVHKARMGVRGFPESEKQISREWLNKNGYKTVF
jgi:hypothetical protein